MIEPEFVLELPVQLLDRPPAPGHRDQGAQRGCGVEIEQVVFPFVVDQRALAQEPALAPALGGAHADRGASGVHIVSTDRMATP